MNPVRRAAELLFVRQLRVRWHGGPKLAWEHRELARAAQIADAESARRRDLAQIIEQLAEVLDEMPDLRDSVRHLAFFEQALLQQGLQALHAVPLQVLQQALDQFEGLVSNWSPRGLALLRSKMAVTIVSREAKGEPSELPPPPGLDPSVPLAARVRFSVGRG